MLGLVKYQGWTTEQLEARKNELDLKIETESWDELQEYEDLIEELFYRRNPIPETTLRYLGFE
jgi:hypothetical protein